MHPGLTDSVDRWLLEGMNDHRNVAVTWFSRHLMAIGHTVPGVIACAVIVLLIVAVLKLWRPAFATGIAFVVAGEIAQTLKNLIDRPRPPASLAIVPAYGYSMPSSVAACCSAAALAFFIVVWPSPGRRTIAGMALVAAQLVIGFAMIYLGAHWTTDVFAGWILGVVVGLIVGQVFRPTTRVSVPSA